MLNNLLLYRLAIINLLGSLLVAYAFSQGWVARIIESDTTGAVWAVIGLFAVFLVSLTVRALKVGAQLNKQKLRRGARSPGDLLNGNKWLEKNAHLDELPDWIMIVGLVGNVLGIMLSIDAANLAGGDAGASIENLLGSMDIAFGATVVSGILGVWAMINARVLRTATVLMIEDSKLGGGK